MPIDSFIDTIRHRFGHRRGRASKENQHPSSIADDHGKPRGVGSQQIHGHFTNANNFILKNATIGETNYYINNTISNKNAGLEFLWSYTMPDATINSSARHPPPTCHPETRLTIRNKLKDWLNNPKRQSRMVWLRGPAGTGKSAVAQTFAEHCAKWKRLGAAYFFSRANNRNKPETVVPSLVYQLAVTIPEYKSIITIELANDPDLLHKAPPVQFRKLIVEPFSALQRQYPREPIVIVLDGLDECKGTDTQLEIIDMITEALRLHEDFPLLWLVCSRPEVHLKQAFSRMADCGREELVIDAECRDDVEQYLRDGTTGIKSKYEDITPSNWPSEAQLTQLIHIVSGLFMLASTALSYIGDSTSADPVGQLDYLLTFLKSAQAVGSRNPLVALDLLYSRILSDVPPGIFPTTYRILANFIRTSSLHPSLTSAQALCNFLRLDQHVFYRALRGLHSVVSIPEPADAARSHLSFHHTSFRDFLLNPHRCGKFAIEERKVLVDMAKSALFWYEIDVKHFHTNDEWNYGDNHQHDKLPGLSWTSADDEQRISAEVMSFAHVHCCFFISLLSRTDVDTDILSRIFNIDFRYVLLRYPSCIADWVYKHDTENTLVRTKPSSPTDFLLLEYFNLVIKNGVAKPATFPLFPRPWTREYYFIGHGTKSAIVWITVSSGIWKDKTHMLNGNKAPSEAQISIYEEDLKKIGWKEEVAKKHFESRVEDDDEKRVSAGKE